MTPKKKPTPKATDTPIYDQMVAERGIPEEADASYRRLPELAGVEAA